MAPQRYSPLPFPRKTRSPVALKATNKSTQRRIPWFSRAIHSYAPDRSRRDQTNIELGRMHLTNVHQRHPQMTTGYRQVLDNIYEDHDGDDAEQEAAESCLFHWEDEKTLVSDMMNDGQSTGEESEDSKLNSLAESIQDSFSLYSKELIDDIADTLVPAVNRVKQAHNVLNREMDGEFAEGLHHFVHGCRAMEDVTTPECDRVREVYCGSQARIKLLFNRLHDTCMRRDQLWKDLEMGLEEIINPSKEKIKTLTTHVERAIANLEKQSKQIAQKDNGGTEKMYKGFLNQI